MDSDYTSYVVHQALRLLRVAENPQNGAATSYAELDARRKLEELEELTSKSK